MDPILQHLQHDFGLRQEDIRIFKNWKKLLLELKNLSKHCTAACSTIGAIDALSRHNFSQM